MPFTPGNTRQPPIRFFPGPAGSRPAEQRRTVHITPEAGTVKDALIGRSTVGFGPLLGDSSARSGVYYCTWFTVARVAVA
jgi:hypothetical protein